MSKTAISAYFETKKRDSGDEFVTLRDNRPEWLQSAVYEAHTDAGPNDWVYEECRAACSRFDEGDFSDDEIHAYADERVDVYTQARFEWAAKFCLTGLYASAEEESAELVAKDASIEDRLGAIQYCAIASIARTMIEACRENVSES